MELPSSVLPTALSGKTTALREMPGQRLTGDREGGSAGRIVVEVMEGPMDGAFAIGSRDQIRIGRAPGDDLELHSDRSVSTKHAVLSRTDNPRIWRLEDTRSLNGTWVDGVDIRSTAAQMLPLDSCFMVGNTVVRLSARDAEQSFTPDALQLQDGAGRLVSHFTAKAAEGYGAAIGLAAAEGKSYLTDRHLFLGLSATNADLSILARGKGSISSSFLAEVLWRNEHWTGATAWIDQRLRSSAVEDPVLFAEEFVVTPRLLRILLAAEEGVQRAGAESIEPTDLFRAFFEGPENRPRELLLRDGINPRSLLQQLASPSPVGAAKAPRGQHSRTAAPATCPTTTVLVSSGDVALDARAQEAARRLSGIAALYQLADPEDRFLAIKQLLVEEVAPLPPENRPRLLEQLARLFPLMPDAAGVAASLSSLDRTYEKPRPEPVSQESASSTWSKLLADLLADKKEIPPADFAPQERPMVDFITIVVSFAVDIERFILSVVQSLRAPGLGTQNFQLPGHKISIQGFVRDLAAGRSPRREALGAYLSSLELWLVAAIAAHHEGPELWFKEFWRKVSPAAIESRPAEDKLKRLLPSLEYWNRYKEKVRTLSSDLVSDEILHIVRRQAEEKYHQLSERRGSS